MGAEVYGWNWLVYHNLVAGLKPNNHAMSWIISRSFFYISLNPMLHKICHKCWPHMVLMSQMRGMSTFSNQHIHSDHSEACILTSVAGVVLIVVSIIIMSVTIVTLVYWHYN